MRASSCPAARATGNREQRHQPVGFDLEQPERQPPGARRVVAAVEQEIAGDPLRVRPQVGEHAGRPVEQSRADGIAAEHRRYRRGALAGAEVERRCHQQLSGECGQPFARRAVVGILEERVSPVRCAEERPGRELGVPLPAQRPVTCVERTPARLGAGLGLPQVAAQCRHVVTVGDLPLLTRQRREAGRDHRTGQWCVGPRVRLGEQRRTVRVEMPFRRHRIPRCVHLIRRLRSLQPAPFRHRSGTLRHWSDCVSSAALPAGRSGE